MTKKTHADYSTGMAAALPDNDTGEISPADLRGELTHLNDSALFEEDGTRIVASVDAALGGEEWKTRADLSSVEIVSVAASRTLIASDAGKVLRITADGVTLTVDDAVFTANQVVTIRLAIAGTVTVADGTATVTQTAGYTKTISVNRAQAILHFVSASAADLVGGLDAA